MRPRREIRPPSTDLGADPLPRLRLGAMMPPVLAGVGHGLWMLQGMALALGMYPQGRSDVLVPLAVGMVFASLGLVLAWLHRAWAPEWHGWRLGGALPTREALLALAVYLPMLAVAGLARGNDQFWATRLAGAVLVLCCLVSLVSTALADARGRMPGQGQAPVANLLPLSRVVSAAYGGGLWLWLCLAGQNGGSVPARGALPWVLALLLLALLLGLVEGMRWQNLQVRYPAMQRHVANQRWRYLAAALVYALPCLALVLASMDAGDLWLAAVAALAFSVGKCIERGLYDQALPGTS